MTATFAVTDAQGRTEPDPEPPSVAELSTRAFVGRWLRGEDVGAGSTGGFGGVKGHPDCLMDGAAMTADLWRAVSLLAEDLQAVCHLSRLLEWRSMIWTTTRDGEETTRTVWYVAHGWAGVLDPTVVARAAYRDRRRVAAWQTTVRRRCGYVDVFSRRVDEAKVAIAELLGERWLNA